MEASVSSGHGQTIVSRILYATARWCMYLLVFFLPLTFLPWTTELLEINKQTLFVLLAVLAVVSWMGAMVFARRLLFRGGWLNLFPVLLFVSVLLSSLFSLSGYTTWIGQSSQEYTSFLSLALFILLFFLLMHTASGLQLQRKILFALLCSATLSGLVTLLGSLGLFRLPFDFAQSAGFNTVGTINGFSIFMLSVMFVGMALWLVTNGKGDAILPAGVLGIAMKALILVQSLITLFLLVAVDFWVFWVLSLAGVALLFLFEIVQSKRFPHPIRFGLPLLVLAVSILLLFLPSPLKLGFPAVVSPSYQTSWNITRQALGTDTKSLLLGTGPGTFALNYARYKPVEVNQTAFWNVRFDRAQSFALTALATFGVVGFGLAVLLFASLGIRGLGKLLRERDAENWKMTYVIFVGWSVIVLSHLLYSSNFTMQFLLWLFSGLLAAQVAGKLWMKNFTQAPKTSLVFAAGFVVLAVAVLAGLFVSVQRYQAELAFAHAVELSQGDAPITDVVQELARATRKNGLNDVYYRNLSSALLLQAAGVIASAEGAELSSEQVKQVSALVSTSVNAAKTATDIEPNNPSNWSARGAIYRDVMSFVGNAEDFAAATFQTAAMLEPVNPIHYTNLGRIHLAVADRAATFFSAEEEELRTQAAEAHEQQLAAAEQAFGAAVAVKTDYAPAHYWLAVVYERQGRLEESAARLAVLAQNNPSDVGLVFELGILLLRLQDLENAKTAFEHALTVSPDHSNSMWYLASVYELQGDQEKAIQLIERVLELNPGNELVASRLERMKAGEITTRIPQPIEPGVEVAPEPGGLPQVPDEEGTDAEAEPEAPAEE